MANKVLMGAELLSLPIFKKSKWGRCAFLGNQASVDKDYVSAYKKIKDLLGDKLICCLAPQHGYWAVEQDNMIESRHESLGAHPLYSLYSEVREPTGEMLKSVDTIIVDLQIVGCRVYTFKSTIVNCLKVAKQSNKKVLILDRPNPINGMSIEGPVLDLELKSFVGPGSIPMRHSLTVGEIAQYFNQEIKAQLTVVSMCGWKPEYYWCDYSRDWVYTSPNLPPCS